jgi:hypothetical protein
MDDPRRHPHGDHANPRNPFPHRLTIRTPPMANGWRAADRHPPDADVALLRRPSRSAGRHGRVLCRRQRWGCPQACTSDFGYTTTSDWGSKGRCPWRGCWGLAPNRPPRRRPASDLLLRCGIAPADRPRRPTHDARRNRSVPWTADNLPTSVISGGVPAG